VNAQLGGHKRLTMRGQPGEFNSPGWVAHGNSASRADRRNIFNAFNSSACRGRIFACSFLFAVRRYWCVPVRLHHRERLRRQRSWVFGRWDCGRHRYTLGSCVPEPRQRPQRAKNFLKKPRGRSPSLRWPGESGCFLWSPSRSWRPRARHSKPRQHFLRMLTLGTTSACLQRPRGDGEGHRRFQHVTQIAPNETGTPIILSATERTAAKKILTKPSRRFRRADPFSVSRSSEFRLARAAAEEGRFCRGGANTLARSFSENHDGASRSAVLARAMAIKGATRSRNCH